ncbi:HAMP domain-containing sensor histidine kinase [Thiolapillus brandeum]|uniref:histidine kinase n=1 Tax=Thiolapillus brandeum TaxID=1076588 RepID=A0A7U6JIQ6_9GAMM|nr:ATP-binding protein [Thiolapillus brandeum]BAO45546.1 two-component system NtrC family sensor histidine kinase YfhK [Thiolapillus brandeum]
MNIWQNPRMSFKPASILQLALLGFFLAAIPLVLGLLNTKLQVDRLGEKVQQVVQASIAAVESGRLISAQALNMERSALQYLVLGDDAILSRYENQRQQFAREVQRLLSVPGDPVLAGRLEALRDNEARLYQKLLLAPARGQEQRQGLKKNEQLAGLASTIPFDVTARVSRESRRINDEIDVLRKLLLWQALVLIPVALLVAVIFSLLIANSLRRLGRAIRRLGGGELAGPIRVRGPQDVRELGEQLDWLRRRLIALQEQKTHFLHHVSHELKTPLTAIREAAELLDEEITGKLLPEQAEVVGILRENSLQLQAQVESLLNFNLALAEDKLPRRLPVDLASLVPSALKKHELTLKARSMDVKLDLQPATMIGDKDQLQAVIDNLLSNAIKYSPDGTQVSISLRRENQQLILDVLDQGWGIGETDRQHLFEPFYQGKSPSTSPVRGTGLGLSLVRRYLDLHGGTVELLDTPQGAHFRVRLPVGEEA